MKEESARSVGLGGDGDEVYAIQNVEKTLAVSLDYGDAPKWATAGDVYQSLLKALPAEEAVKPDLWDRFAAALCEETGVDPKTIRPESPLLVGSLGRLATVSFVLLVVLVVAAAFAIGYAGF